MDKEALTALLKEHLRISLSEEYHYSTGGNFTLRAAILFDGEEIDFDFISFNIDN